jgi:hypothetical protein
MHLPQGLIKEKVNKAAILNIIALYIKKFT